MQRTMLKSKIHRATVTDANVDYEGSIAIDELLMEEADIREFEQVSIYNVTNGHRFETYVIKGDKGSGTISINGAAAHRAAIGELVIIASYSSYAEAEVSSHRPVLVYVDADNVAVRVSSELKACI